MLTINQGKAGRDPTALENPMDFRPGRPSTAHMSFGWGPHECLGREICLTYVTGLIKLVSGLKNLRPAPGEMGVLKSVQVGTDKCYLNDDWSYLTFDPTSKLPLLFLLVPPLGDHKICSMTDISNSSMEIPLRWLRKRSFHEAYPHDGYTKGIGSRTV